MRELLLKMTAEEAARGKSCLGRTCLVVGKAGCAPVPCLSRRQAQQGWVVPVPAGAVGDE